MTDVPITTFPVNLTDFDGFLWDIDDTVVGSTFTGIDDGTSDAFDGGFRWTDYDPTGGTHVLTDDREVNFGETTLLNNTGLIGSRSIYVSDTKGYARFLDTITNTTAADITYTYTLFSDLGSDSATQVLASGNGNTTFESADSYITTDDGDLAGGDPTVTHIYHDGSLLPTTASQGSGSVVTDEFTVTYTITIPAGESVSFLSFGFQNATPADAAAQVADFDANFPDYIEGLSGEELAQVANFDFTGTSTGDDVIVGTDGNDTLDGGDGEDTIFGLEGDDILTGGFFADTIDGGAGNDTIIATGQDFGDNVDGGTGIDLLDLTGHIRAQTVNLETGVWIDPNAHTGTIVNVENVTGGNANDTITGDAGDNVLNGNGGDDIINAGTGVDVVNAGEGNDTVFFDTSFGADALDGGNGIDSLTTASAFSAGNVIDLEAGEYRFNGFLLSTVTNFENYANTNTFSSPNGGFEEVLGTDGVNVITTAGGDNIIEGRGGADILDGGAGNDTVSYESSSTGVVVNLDANIIENGDAQGDVLSNFENITGSAFGDFLVGTSGVNILIGGAGNDTVNGGTGLDEHYGGDGDDSFQIANALWVEAGETYDGGAGVDNFRVTGGLSTDLSVVTITDVEEIRFTEGEASGSVTLTAAQFNGFTDVIVTDQSAAVISTLNINMGTSTSANFSGFTFTGWSADDVINITGDADNESITGTSENDIIDSGSGNDRIDGGTGADTINGGNDDDTFGFDAGDIAVGLESISGGTGTDALFLVGTTGGPETYDFRGSTVQSIEALNFFYNFSGNERTAVFNSSQIGTGLLSSTLAIDADEDSFSSNNIEIIMETASLDISGWVFNSEWDSEDTVTITGDNSDETITGSSVNDVIDSGEGSDTLNGGAGDDILTGGFGTDTVNGGAGDDTIIISQGIFIGSSEAHFNDVIDGGIGTDTLDFTGYDSPANLINVDLLAEEYISFGNSGDTTQSITGVENVTGSDNDDTLAGDAQANVLIGADGNDTIDGGDGNDTISGGLGDDTLTGGAGIDTLDFSDFAAMPGMTGVSFSDIIGTAQDTGEGMDIINGFEVVIGSGGDDAFIMSGITSGVNNTRSVMAGDGNDTVTETFLLGGDFADGGDGIDTFIYDDTLGMIFDMTTGALTAASGGLASSFINFENAVGTDDAGQTDTITGTSGANTIDGRAGVDILDGAGGNDTLNGGDGDDILTGGEGDDIIRGQGGSDTLVLSGNFADYTITDNGNGSFEIVHNGGGADGTDTLVSIESVQYADGTQAFAVSGSDINLTNNDDTFTATGADEVINALDGNDSIFAGAGNDTVNGGNGNDFLRGQDGDDILDGGFGADFLQGGAGADVLNGFAGQDWAYYASSPSAITIDLAAGTASGGTAQGDTFSFIERVYGSSHNDTITGDSNVNYLRGAGGDDILNGGAGNDYLQGDAGADTFDGGTGTGDYVYYASSAVGLTVNLGNTALNTGEAVGDSYTNIENLLGSRHDDNLTGDAANNFVRGLQGDDMLFGGDGNDFLRGDQGADFHDGQAGVDWVYYATSSAGVTIDLGAGTASGGDAAGDTFASIERVYGSSSADSITGDSGANYLRGSFGDDVLNGGDGNDFLQGDSGGDTLDGGAGTDSAYYASAGTGITIDLGNAANNTGEAAGDSYTSIENIVGGRFDDNITGDSGANTLRGFLGDDTLNGGAGDDILRGEAGADTFVFEVGGDNDVIIDWVDADDMLDLTAFGFADTAAAMATAAQVGADVVFTIGTDTITIEDTTTTDIMDNLIL